MITAELAEKSARLPIHIQVPTHFLLAKEQVVAVNSLIVCLEEVNKRLFENRIHCELIVLPDEEGTHKTVTKIVVKGVGYITAGALTLSAIGGMISFTETDSFKGFVHGVTGKEIKHYETSKEIGELLHDIIVGLYTTENEQLEESIPPEINLDKAIKAKSDFYEMCLDNPQIAAVGFDDSENFPVQRGQFPYHTSKDRSRKLQSEFKLFDTIIVSPVTIDKDAKWELQDVHSKISIKAYLRDEDFRNEFLSGDHPLKTLNTDDRMKVLIEYEREEKNGEIKYKNTYIKKVYELNDEVFAEIPDIIQPPDDSKDERPMDSLWFAG